MDQAEILDDCLNRMREGVTVEDCLRQYAAQADELAPMLAAAQRVAVLRTATISEPQRVRAKAALRRAAVDTVAASGTSAPGIFGGLSGDAWLSRARLAALAGTVAVVILLAGMVTAVAASGPGDLPYGVRLLVEQVPTWLHPSAEARALAELAIADRRLADLQVYLAHTAKIDTQALEALLSADAAAIRMSAGLSPEARERVLAAVQDHAKKLRALAGQTQTPAASGALERAADEVGGPMISPEPATPASTSVPTIVPSVEPTPVAQSVSLAPEAHRAESKPAPTRAIITPAPRSATAGDIPPDEPEMRKGRTRPHAAKVVPRVGGQPEERGDNSRRARGDAAPKHPDRPGQNQEHGSSSAGHPQQKSNQGNGSSDPQKGPPPRGPEPDTAPTREKR